MKLVDVKIGVPDDYELTDLEPVQLNFYDSYLSACGAVNTWGSLTRSTEKYFRVRRIPQPPQVKVKLKPGWLVKDCHGVFWCDNKPNLLDDGIYHSSGLCFACPQGMVSVEFPEGVTLMEVV